MNKIDALTEMASRARRRGEKNVEIDISTMLQLLSIVDLAFNKEASIAENKARDFANYWLIDVDFSASEPEDF